MANCQFSSVMSEGHVNACSASTSSSSTSVQKSSRIPSFCVNEIPWKLVPQEFEETHEYEFINRNYRRVTDVESFVWKWSPCGRYGIDLPGGRDLINDVLKNRMAVFDMHKNTWSLYTIDAAIFDIPRLCFIYWARSDIIATVSLVKDYEPGPDDEVPMKFKQSFYYISHERKTLEHTSSCKYRTDKTIVASYWYHIFENRRGEPFIDHNNDLWLVFSNGKDCLILLPFLPTQTIFQPKYVHFDMSQIVTELIGTRVFLDPFISSHFVPFVHRHEINFFVRIDQHSFLEEHDRDYARDPAEEDAATEHQRGVFQIRLNLKDVIERAERAAGLENAVLVESKFASGDVDFWRRLAEDHRQGLECFAQHGKMVVLQKWHHFTIDMKLSKRMGTRVADMDARKACCSHGARDFAFCSIDLDTEQVKYFDTMVLGTDVILPHPSGSVFMFRYKEHFAVTYCELPYFQPVSLRLKCIQMASGSVELDPLYYSSKCCLKMEQ